MRILFTIAILIGTIWILSILRDVLLPFFVACLLAYILEPLVRFNMKILFLKKSRCVPVILTLLEVGGGVALFCWLFFPYLMQECAQMADAITKYTTSKVSIPYISQQIHDFIRDNIDINDLSKWLSREEWMKLAKNAITSSWNFVSSSVAFIIGAASWLIVLLYLFFIMLDYDKLVRFGRRLVPAPYRHRVFTILDDVKNAMNRYFRGQFLIAMIVGVLFAIGFIIIDLPMAVAFGLFIGVLNLVPYLQLVSLPVALVLCIVAFISNGIPFWTILLETLAVYAIVQIIQDMILTPRIMGKAMGLNPAIILLSLSVWGALLGFTGMIIALPLTTLLLSYYNRGFK